MNKIIFGITGLTLGGAERVLVDIANALVDKYDITIFTLYSKGEIEKELDKKIPEDYSIIGYFCPYVRNDVHYSF